MYLSLADRSIKYPEGILENVPIKVGKFYIPVDFVILDMEEDTKVPILLGRPFLATVGALIDVKDEKLTLRVGDDQMIFNINPAMKRKHEEVESCLRVDIIDEILSLASEKIENLMPFTMQVEPLMKLKLIMPQLKRSSLR
ncbi:hypothetical protein P3X46_018147 [Hevea brasiliensis]|uniref:Aspartic peptidase DDI1-type domain-containing protein n=1 Tax=Hevea brasiliensis TaxID=3981 RepID=A0ABQ9LR60_HEVBR|nr:hypothetical protein P3X46_018147 [Hevea brasiliensis]